MMKPVIAIVGPTGVGKTKLSLALARLFDGEIISTDSMQFYKGLDIGTAKISPEQRNDVKHHLIDILNPEEEYSVAEYQEIVRQKIGELHARDIMPILVGGSGLYVQSVLYDYKFKGEKRDEDFVREYDGLEVDELYELLLERNPRLAHSVDRYNRRRVLRALEKSDKDMDETGTELYYSEAIIIGLNLDRDVLYERIDKRVDEMMDKGLLDEAKELFDKEIETQAISAIGYKELFPYFRDEMPLDTCVDIIKRNSRRYAKRQLTWFKNKMDADWFEVDLENFNDTVEQVYELIKTRLV